MVLALIVSIEQRDDDGEAVIECLDLRLAALDEPR